MNRFSRTITSSPYVKKQIQKDSQKKTRLMNQLGVEFDELLKHKEFSLALQDAMQELEETTQKEREALESQINRLKQLLNKERQAKESAEEKVELLQGNIENVKKDIAKYGRILQQLKKNYEESKDENIRLNELSNSRLREITRLKQTEQELQEQIDQYEQELGEKEVLEKQLNNKIGRIEKQKQTIDEDLLDINTMIKDFSSGKALLQNKYNLFPSDRRSSSTRSSSRSSSRRKSISPTLRLKQNIFQILKDLAKTTKERDNLNEQVTEQETHIEELNNEKTNLSTQINVKSDQNQTLKNMLHLLTRAILPLQSKVESLSLQNQYLKGIEKDHQQLTKELDSLHYELTNRRIVRTPTDKFRKIVTNLIELKHVHPLKKILSEPEPNSYYVQGTENNVSLDERKKVTTIIPTQLYNIMKDYHERDPEIDQDTEYKDVESFVDMISYFSPKYFTKREEIEMGSRNRSSYSEKSEREFLSEFGTKRSSIRSTSSRKSSSVIKRSPVVQKIRNVTRKIRSQLQNINNEKNQLSERLENISNERDQLEFDLKESENKNNEKQETLASLQDQFNNSKRAIINLRNKTKILQEEKKFLVPLEQYNTISSELTNIKRLLSSQTRDLNSTKNNLTQAEDEIEKLKDEILGKNTLIQKLNRNVQLKNTQIEELNNQLQNLRNDNQDLNEQISKKENGLNKFKSLISQMKKRDQDMRRKCGFLDKQVNAFRKHMDVLKEEISTTLDKEIEEGSNSSDRNSIRSNNHNYNFEELELDLN
ncbi:structural maintenance of chromosomes protein [Anaeramoeba flamelloides]|uniref:Structural maintenance of chromosomes protein n=1 Tax=Anaeramoeba flamelloides TaxID=1746091 RepID=A0ABQ8Y639_9EUKA|nr:structural maintenance of chromosomes protein [Anaeramoeba flamelloides]